LTVCVESGLGLSQALQRVADELEVSHPELASEIAQVTAQMRAGVERETALRSLSTRTGLDDVRGLVGLLVQTLRFGTGIAAKCDCSYNRPHQQNHVALGSTNCRP